MAKYTKRRHVKRTKKHGKKHARRRGTRRYRGGAKSGLYKEENKLSGTDGKFANLTTTTKNTYHEGESSGMEEVIPVSVPILKQFTQLLDGAVRIKNGVNLYKISIIETPFSMKWTKEGFGIARSVGRLAASVGVIKKTENSEDTAARNIAAMYPVNNRQRIETEFKQIVGGNVWASVAKEIVFTPSKISVYVGVVTGTKEITINTPDYEDKFKEKIKQMYINMNDDITDGITDGITTQPGQENMASP